jgi:hypothetical protein
MVRGGPPTHEGHDAGTVVRLRIELQDIEPKIWRSVDVPLSATLLGLHDVIQAAMRWQHAHLFEFRIADRVYGEPYPDDDAFGRKVHNARNLRLKQLIDRGVERLLYVYDFGDDWRHDVIVEEVRDGDTEVDYPAFVDGARRAPPEDVGGPPGFMDFLEAVLDPDHEERERLLTWCGGVFDPDDIDRRAIEIELAMLAEFRRRALLGHRNRKQDKPG